MESTNEHCLPSSLHAERPSFSPAEGWRSQAGGGVEGGADVLSVLFPGCWAPDFGINWRNIIWVDNWGSGQPRTKNIWIKRVAGEPWGWIYKASVAFCIHPVTDCQDGISKAHVPHPPPHQPHQAFVRYCQLPILLAISLSAVLFLSLLELLLSLVTFKSFQIMTCHLVHRASGCPRPVAWRSLLLFSSSAEPNPARILCSLGKKCIYILMKLWFPHPP